MRSMRSIVGIENPIGPGRGLPLFDRREARQVRRGPGWGPNQSLALGRTPGRGAFFPSLVKPGLGSGGIGAQAKSDAVSPI